MKLEKMKTELEARGFREEPPASGQWRKSGENPNLDDGGGYVFVTAFDGTSVDNPADELLVGFYDLTDEKFAEMVFRNIKDFFRHWDH